MKSWTQSEIAIGVWVGVQMLIVIIVWVELGLLLPNQMGMSRATTYENEFE